MKRAVVVTIALLTLIIVSSLQTVEVAKANPIPWAFNPQMTVTVLSPENNTINSLPILVSFTSKGDQQFSVSDNTTAEWVRSFFYILDGQDMRSMGVRFEGTKTTPDNHFTGQAYIENLTDGFHTITVYYGAVNSINLIGSLQEQIVYNTKWQATAQFYVNIKLDPSPTPTNFETNSPSPKPSPTAIETTSPITQTPTATPLENGGVNANVILTSELIIAVVIVSAILSLVLAVVVYRRRKALKQ